MFQGGDSRENLACLPPGISAAEIGGEDPQLFVALYDFYSAGENQLSLRKGEQVIAAGLEPVLRHSIRILSAESCL